MNARFSPPADDAAEPPAHVPKHEAFSWLHRSLKDNAHAEFLALTFDVCKGAELCLELVREAGLERDHDPMGGFLSSTQSGYLEGLAIRSLRMLAERAEDAISDLNDVALRREAGGAK